MSNDNRPWVYTDEETPAQTGTYEISTYDGPVGSGQCWVELDRWTGSRFFNNGSTAYAWREVARPAPRKPNVEDKARKLVADGKCVSLSEARRRVLQEEERANKSWLQVTEKEKKAT